VQGRGASYERRDETGLIRGRSNVSGDDDRREEDARIVGVDAINQGYQSHEARDLLSTFLCAREGCKYYMCGGRLLTLCYHPHL
jgi:hypothetical protein